MPFQELLTALRRISGTEKFSKMRKWRFLSRDVHAHSGRKNRSSETITENTSISIICIVDNDETHADLVQTALKPITIRYPAEKANFTAEHFVPDRCWRAYPVS